MRIHSNVTVKMPAGRYYVGDLCYVMHPQWEEFCDKTIVGNDCISGEVLFDNGVRVAQFNTAYGDGRYEDQFGHEYGVDAGLIGCIRFEDINDPKSYLKGGHIVGFDSDFECSESNGVISFGHICINTGDDDEPEFFDEESEES